MKLGIGKEPEYMQSQAGATSRKTNRSANRKLLSQRVPRMGKVLFSENSAPVHCAVKNLAENKATLTMSGWLGLPSSFVLFVEPDAIRAECRVILRRGSNIDVEFTSIEEETRFRASA